MGDVITPELIATMRQTKRSACPKCGAKNEKQAETKCRPSQDETGEYSCPGSDGMVDAQGWFLGPTKAAEAASSVYWGEICRQQEAEMEADHLAIMLDRRMPPTPDTGLPYYGCPDDWGLLPGVSAFCHPKEPSHDR